MLGRDTPTDLTVRNTIAAVSSAGLVLLIAGGEHHVSWKAVNSIGVSATAHGDAEIFVIALCVDDGEATRVFVVAEIEKIWPQLTEVLPIGLPGVEPFERWGSSLAQKPGVLMLYERAEP